jgi:hypothetical protein
VLLTEHHAMKVYWGNGGIVPHILDLGTKRRCVASFMSRPLYPQGKSPWCPLYNGLGRPQSRSGRGGENKIVFPISYSITANHCTFLLLHLFPRITHFGLLVPFFPNLHPVNTSHCNFLFSHSFYRSTSLHDFLPYLICVQFSFIGI